MTRFSYYLVQDLIDELEQEGIKISRTTIYRMEQKGYFKTKRSPGNWRVFAREDVPVVKQIIKEAYNLSPEKFA